MKNHGLKPEELAISESAVRDIIRYYTREAGVRALERELSKICRKVVKTLVRDGEERKVAVSARNLDKYLGVRRYTYGMAEKRNQVGQVSGLAWTEVGGELLTIEAAIMPGKGKMTTTGKLGEVMQESVQAALSVVRSRSRRLGIPVGLLPEERHPHPPAGRRDAQGRAERRHRHLHRDGVRADRHSGARRRGDDRARSRCAGEVLQIGGLKEKLLAAHRGGIKTVLIPEENVKDLAEIPDNIKNRLDIHPVKWIDSVFELALERKPEPLSDDDVAPPLPPVTEAPAPAAVKH